MDEETEEESAKKWSLKWGGGGDTGTTGNSQYRFRFSMVLYIMEW